MQYQVLAAGGVFELSSRTVVPPDRSTAAWQTYQAWLTAGGVPLPPDTVGQGTLDESKAARCEEINAYAAGVRNAAVRGRSTAEMSTWPLKLVEARAYTAAPVPQSAPLLAAIAAERGITTADLAARVMVEATFFLTIEAQIDGTRGRHCDAIEACTTVGDIIIYDWRSGWPLFA
jgi:hypothetical protein